MTTGYHIKIVSIALLLFFISLSAAGQADTAAIASELAKKNLTYYWTGRFCPRFIYTEYYGFKIKCVGCIVTREVTKKNRRVVRQVNKAYGRKWFRKNRENFTY